MLLDFALCASQMENPYESPDQTTRAPLPPEPNVSLWVAVMAGAFGAIAAALEWAGLWRLTEMLPLGAGGVVVGMLIGAVAGRAVGRLLLARHRFLSVAHRREEMNESLLDARGMADDDR